MKKTERKQCDLYQTIMNVFLNSTGFEVSRGFAQNFVNEIDFLANKKVVLDFDVNMLGIIDWIKDKHNVNLKNYICADIDLESKYVIRSAWRELRKQVNNWIDSQKVFSKDDVEKYFENFTEDLLDAVYVNYSYGIKHDINVHAPENLNLRCAIALNMPDVDRDLYYDKFKKITSFYSARNDKRYGILKWLLETQGYNLKDLDNAIKNRTDSVFLNSLSQELNEFKLFSGNYCGALAIFIKPDLEILQHFATGGDIQIDASVCCGFVTIRDGISSHCNIKLEKPIIVNKKMMHNITINQLYHTRSNFKNKVHPSGAIVPLCFPDKNIWDVDIKCVNKRNSEWQKPKTYEFAMIG